MGAGAVMAASPQYKVSNPSGEYVASCKYLEDAACLVAFLGAGATIKWLHGPVIWHEGHEDQPASESYDHVRDLASARVQTLQDAAYDRAYGDGAARRLRESNK